MVSGALRVKSTQGISRIPFNSAASANGRQGNLTSSNFDEKKPIGFSTVIWAAPWMSALKESQSNKTLSRRICANHKVDGLLNPNTGIR